MSSHLAPLELYRQAFGFNAHQYSAAERYEIMIEVCPGDEVPCVTARLGSVGQLSPKPTPLLRISSPAGGSLEITELASSDPEVILRCQQTSGGATISGTSSTLHDTRELTVTFRLWEACSPLSGNAPYLTATLSIEIASLYRDRRPLLLTLSTPASASPRSTRGNYVLAYPSRLDGDRRLTNIYYATPAARIEYRFGSNDGLAGPWISIGKAGVTALLIFVVAILATHVDEGNRLSALIAVFIAVAGLLWDFSREISSFAVYNAIRSRIQVTVLSAQIAVLGVLGFAVFALTSRSDLLPSAGYASIVLAGLLIAVAVLALVGLSKGYWQGYQCDHEGCTSTFRWRHARPECHYTGRVYCAQHINTVCDSCVHGADLRSRRLDSAASYGTTGPTPCVVPATARP